MQILISRGQRVPLLTVIILGAALLVVPFPGSLSVVVTHSLALTWAGVSGIDLLSEVMLAALAVATVAAGISAWRRGTQRRALLVAASAGVVLAYVLSEAGKMLFAQERPCVRWTLPGECPPLDDWSLPSNHATLAFGAVVVIALATRRAWATWAALAAAVLVAAGRILQGVHYLHDVALGALLGLAVPAIVVLIVATVRLKRSAGSAEDRGSISGFGPLR